MAPSMKPSASSNANSTVFGGSATPAAALPGAAETGAPASSCCETLPCRRIVCRSGAESGGAVRSLCALLRRLHVRVHVHVCVCMHSCPEGRGTCMPTCADAGKDGGARRDRLAAGLQGTLAAQRTSHLKPVSVSWKLHAGTQRGGGAARGQSLEHARTHASAGRAPTDQSDGARTRLRVPAMHASRQQLAAAGRRVSGVGG